MTAPERKIPAFFKVYVPELCSLRMKIPSRFTSYMKGKLPDSAAFLRDRCGNVWSVGVIREGCDLYFEKGWVRFVEDNGVETGDFLVFQFSGDYFYDFKHCGRTACGKETTSFNFTIKKEKSEGEDNEEEDDTNYDNENEDDEEEEDYVDDEDYEEDENVLFESSHAHVQIPTSTKRGKGKAVVKQEADLVNTFKRGYRGQKMGADIFKSSLIVQPENHHFVARQRLRKRNELKKSEEEVEENEKEEEEEEDVDDDDESDDDFEEDDENEDDDEEEEDDDDEDYEEEEDDPVKKTRMIKSMKEFESSYAYVQKIGTSTKRGKGVVLKHEADIFKSGLILQPENPYFIDRLRKGTQSQLFFPKKLIKKHKLDIPEQIIITGEDGAGFVSRISRWSDGRSAANDGWRAFCRWNFVKEGEMFLCEFVTHQELLVRILKYRAGIWMPRPRI